MTQLGNNPLTISFPRYAPESIGRAKFSHASDVWSFGVTLWEIFSYGIEPVYRDPASPGGEVPDSELLDVLKKGVRLQRPLDCPNEVYKLMLKCWNEHAHQRPSVRELKQLTKSMDGFLEE